MMAAPLAARGNRVMYESTRHLVAEVKIIPPMQIAGWEQMFSLLIKINEFGGKCELLNLWQIGMCVHACVSALI